MATKQDRLYKFVNTKLYETPKIADNRGYNKEEQNNLIVRQFQKMVRNDYYDKIAIETDRRSAYLHFEQMEYYPTIASALDVMAEEATLPNDRGRVLNIHSDKTRVKGELEYLFYNILNVNTNLFWWSRNILKNGDMFMLLLGLEDEGITNAKILNKLVQRREEVDEEAQVLRTYFIDEQHNQKYERQQIAHFRLMGSEERIPYGQSVLEKVRKIHKMLVLAEDALMIKRITRSTDRYVYNVNVGNIDPNVVEEYVDAVANKFQTQPIAHSGTGNVDYKYNIKDVTQDYFIPKRGNNVATTIDKIDGSNNLDQVGDIEYLRTELYTGLGVPLPFLNFTEAVGEGKSLSMLDHRFARKTARHQQAIIQELNFIAEVHLILIGLEEEVDSFTLTLNPSSIQKEIMETEHLSNKLNAYQTAVTPSDATQIAPMSELTAKIRILGMSKDEIVTDMQQQMYERAIGEVFRKDFNKIDAKPFFEELMEKFLKKDDEGKEDKDPEEAGQEEVGSAGEEPPTDENPFESYDKGMLKRLERKRNSIINETLNLFDK